jgi:hypothetical protein
MPFDVGESINSLSDAALRAPIVRTTMTNPVYTAMTITFIVIVITMFVFRDAETDEPILILGLRSGFWILMAMMGTLFLHDKVLTQENGAAGIDTAFDSVFTGSYDSTDVPVMFEDAVVPVMVGRGDQPIA